MVGTDVITSAMLKFTPWGEGCGEPAVAEDEGGIAICICCGKGIHEVIEIGAIGSLEHAHVFDRRILRTHQVRFDPLRPAEGVMLRVHRGPEPRHFSAHVLPVDGAVHHYAGTEAAGLVVELEEQWPNIFSRQVGGSGHGRLCVVRQGAGEADETCLAHLDESVAIALREVGVRGEHGKLRAQVGGLEDRGEGTVVLGRASHATDGQINVRHGGQRLEPVVETTIRIHVGHGGDDAAVFLLRGAGDLVIHAGAVEVEVKIQHEAHTRLAGPGDGQGRGAASSS